MQSKGKKIQRQKCRQGRDVQRLVLTFSVFICEVLNCRSHYDVFLRVGLYPEHYTRAVVSSDHGILIYESTLKPNRSEKFLRRIANMISDNDGYEPIGDFYSGKSIFITGATGLLGKMYVEKLLYACMDIEKVYVLVREKKGLHIEERMKRFFEQPIFTRLKRDKPDALKKIILVAGDITAPNLGISADDEEALIQNVSVVIHSAATIKFNEPLKTAYNINVEGTRKVLNLSKRMQNIKIFVYVSTAYSNTNQKVLEEIVYPPPIDLNRMKEIIDNHHILGDDVIELKKLLKFHQNTYTFTKGIAENVVADEHEDIPAIIIRPSIITASEKEPVLGWIDNWAGATGVITSLLKGWNKVLLSENSIIIDIIPLDYVTNLTLVAAAKSSSSKSVRVFNSCSSSVNPITIRDLITAIKLFRAKHNMYENTIILTKSRVLVSFVTFLVQTLPAYTADIWMRLCGRKTKYVKQQSQVISVRDVLEYFTTNSWEMRCTEARSLYSSLSSSDRQLFPFDPTNIVWPDYMDTYISGILKYLLKS